MKRVEKREKIARFLLPSEFFKGQNKEKGENDSAGEENVQQSLWQLKIESSLDYSLTSCEFTRKRGFEIMVYFNYILTLYESNICKTQKLGNPNNFFLQYKILLLYNQVSTDDIMLISIKVLYIYIYVKFGFQMSLISTLIISNALKWLIWVNKELFLFQKQISFLCRTKTLTSKYIDKTATDLDLAGKKVQKVNRK